MTPWAAGGHHAGHQGPEIRIKTFAKGPVTLDADKNIVLLIKNNTQSVKVTSTKDGSSVTKTYALTNLTLES